MTHFEFLAHIAEDPGGYAAFVALAIAVYVAILGRQVYSLLDPLVLALLGASVGAAGVMFLFSEGLISTEALLSFLSTEFAFVFGFALVRPWTGPASLASPPLGASAELRHALYPIAVVVFLGAQVFAYAMRGVPVLKEQRLEYYVGGGFGVVERMIAVSSFLTTYLLCWRVAYRRRASLLVQTCDCGVGAAVLISAALSGSKTSVLGVFAIVSYFYFLHRKNPWLPQSVGRRFASAQRAGIAIGLLAALAVVAAQSRDGNGVVASAVRLLARLAASADVYFMSYANGVLESLHSRQPGLAVFGGLLSTFRLVDARDLPENLGFVINRTVYGIDALVGPNPRHNIFGVVYFGAAGAVLYSFLLGLAVGFVRNTLGRRIRLGGVAELLYVYLAISVVTLPTDVAMLMKSIASMLLVGPPLFFTAALLSFGRHGAPGARRSLELEA